MSVTWETIGLAASGEAIRAVTLNNGRGLSARIMNFGATLLELAVPTRLGRPLDVTLGFDDVQDYWTDHPYFGAVVGRYANRIAGARFSLEGRELVLTANEGNNHLHGGPRGFHKVFWQAADAREAPVPQVTWRYLSRAGEEGYPGNLDVFVTYSLTDDNALRLDYEAHTDTATVLNLTHHAYWNLTGNGDILDHELEIFAARYLPVTPELLPTGELREVAGTPMDFRAISPIRCRLDPGHPQLALAKGGYDHNWVLDRRGVTPALAARLAERRSGIVMEVSTTEPGLQFYSGNFLDGTIQGKGGQRYRKHAGLCLEAQHFPDSPHHPHFPNVVLGPGETYRQTTLYRFSYER